MCRVLGVGCRISNVKPIYWLHYLHSPFGFSFHELSICVCVYDWWNANVWPTSWQTENKKNRPIHPENSGCAPMTIALFIRITLISTSLLFVFSMSNITKINSIVSCEAMSQHTHALAEAHLKIEQPPKISAMVETAHTRRKYPLRKESISNVFEWHWNLFYYE